MLAARAKAMLVDRLTVAEDRLMVLSHQDTMEDLVQAKLRLAQADYLLLEKQVCSCCRNGVQNADLCTTTVYKSLVYIWL
jgi:hypothetical protein